MADSVGLAFKATECAVKHGLVSAHLMQTPGVVVVLALQAEYAGDSATVSCNTTNAGHEVPIWLSAASKSVISSRLWVHLAPSTNWMPQCFTSRIIDGFTVPSIAQTLSWRSNSLENSICRLLTIPHV